jgi:hypothetical protein
VAITKFGARWAHWISWLPRESGTHLQFHRVHPGGRDGNFRAMRFAWNAASQPW